MGKEQIREQGREVKRKRLFWTCLVSAACRKLNKCHVQNCLYKFRICNNLMQRYKHMS